MPRAGGNGSGIVAITGTLLLLLGAVFAARWGMADAIAADAGSLRIEWQQNFVRSGVLPTRDQQQMVLAELNTARSLDGANPQLMEQAGAVLMMPVAVMEQELAASSPMVPAQQAAITAYAAAVVARPVSAFTWINLAKARYQAGQVDTVLYKSLENAARLGPWEPEVQLTIIDLGFALWDEMPEALRPVVKQSVTNAQQLYADRVFSIAERRGRMAVVCGLPEAAVDAAANKTKLQARQLAKSNKCQRLGDS